MKEITVTLRNRFMGLRLKVGAITKDVDFKDNILREMVTEYDKYDEFILKSLSHHKAVVETMQKRIEELETELKESLSPKSAKFDN